MAEVLDQFPAVRHAGGTKPRVNWDQYADGRIYKLTSEDYEGKASALNGKAKRWAISERKNVQYARQGDVFYFQVTGDMSAAQVAAIDAALRAKVASKQEQAESSNDGAVMPVVNPFAA